MEIIKIIRNRTMEMIKRLKIVTASYDNNEELKNGKVVKTVQLSKCVVLGKYYEQPKFDETITEWDVDLDYVDSDESSYKDEIDKNSYHYELSFILKALINHIPNYDGHNAIEITTTKTNITKGFNAIVKLARYLKSNNARAEYTRESIDDFCDYIAYDLALFKTRGKFGEILLMYLPRLVNAIMDCKVNITFNCSTYVYKSYHRGEMTSVRVAKYTKNGKITASKLLEDNINYKVIAELRNDCVVAVKSTCDRLAGFTDSDIQAELDNKLPDYKKVLDNNGTSVITADNVVPITKQMDDIQRTECERMLKIAIDNNISYDINKFQHRLIHNIM